MKLYVLFNKTRYDSGWEFKGVFNSLDIMNNKIKFCEEKYPDLYKDSGWEVKETELNESY